MSITEAEIALVSSLLPGSELGARVVRILESHQPLMDANRIAQARFGARDQPPSPGSFGWAVAQRKPMRRAEWLKHKPASEKDERLLRLLVDATWVWLRPIVDAVRESGWIKLADGQPARLNLFDYEATDWEVME